MVDKITRLASEELARTVDRRGFLKRTGSGAFLLLASWASGHSLGGRTARASDLVGPGRRPAPLPAGSPTAGSPCCAPPGPYCNLNGQNDPNGCQGANCFQHLYNGEVLTCTLLYAFYAAGCWTTNCQGGYYTCCDCQCFDQNGNMAAWCGCAQFSGAPWHGTD